MITFHPAARPVLSGGFVAMVSLRNDKGRMIGSKVLQTTLFATAAEALEHAVRAARRVAAAHPDFMRVREAA